MALEDVVYVLCEGSGSQTVPICGWVVALPGSDAVIAASDPSASSLSHTVAQSVGSLKIRFIRVPQSSLTARAPVGWGGPRPRDLPALEQCLQAWKKAEKASADLESSGAEVPKSEAPAGRARRSLREDIKGLQGLFAEDEGDDDEDETDDEDELPRRKGKDAAFLPPGGRALNKKARGSSEKSPEEPDLRKLVRQGLASGSSPSDLMPLVLMSMVLDKKEPKRKKRGPESTRDLDLLGSSDSDGAEDDHDDRQHSGMKAVATLHKLHENIRRKPRKVIEQFEREVIRELGIVEGQSWTLRDWLRRQPWGKFKGLQRTAYQDVAVYEMLRNGESQAAAAQVIQNLKSKVQCVLAGGDWTTAHLLTGLEDPLSKKDFAGSKQEMAVVSGYLKALADLKKRVKESSGPDHGGDDDGEGGAAAARK